MTPQTEFLEADVRHRRFTVAHWRVSPELASFLYFMDTDENPLNRRKRAGRSFHVQPAPLSLCDAQVSNSILKAPTSARLRPLQVLLTRVPRRDPLGSIKFWRRNWISYTPTPTSFTHAHTHGCAQDALNHSSLYV